MPPGDLGQVLGLVNRMATATNPFMFDVYEVYLEGHFPEAMVIVRGYEYKYWVATRRPRVFFGLWRDNPVGECP